MKKLIIKIVGNYYNAISYVSKDYAAKKALKLFTTPRKGKITEKQAEFLGTSFKEEFYLDGVSIMTYRWLGNKGTILLAHGWESNAARWKKVIQQFNKLGYKIIALDAPAHGRSGGKEFNALLYSEFIAVVAKRFNPQIIIGHSVGGMSAVFFQHKYKLESLEKLILLGAPSEFKDVFERYTNMLGYNQRIIKRLDGIIVERFGRPSTSFSTSNLMKEIKLKSLIIHDKHDHIIPFNDALKIHERAINAKLISTQGMGHSLKNQEVTTYIEEFIISE